MRVNTKTRSRSASPGNRRTRPAARRVWTEDDLHEAIASALDEALPKGWIHQCVENGGSRGKAEAGKLKARGVKPGFPDHMILGPADAPCVFLELKRPGGGRTSEVQERMHETLRAAGHIVGVVRSLDEADAVLRYAGIDLRTDLASAHSRARARKQTKRSKRTR